MIELSISLKLGVIFKVDLENLVRAGLIYAYVRIQGLFVFCLHPLVHK